MDKILKEFEKRRNKMRRIKLALIVLVALGLGLLAIRATQAVIEEEVTKPQSHQVTSNLEDPGILKQEPKQPEYVQGELIVKLREGATLESLKELNEKYKVTSTEKVFKESSDPNKTLAELKDKLAKLNTEHDKWYWQLDKDSKEYKDYIAKIEKEKEELTQRIKSQEELIAHLVQRQKRAQEGATAPDLENIYLLITGQETDTPFMATEYVKHPAVEYAHPNFIFTPDALNPNDPRFSEQYSHTKTQAPLAWEIRHDSSSVNVAVIGVGIDYNHPDLAANIWINQGEIAGNGIDDDNNGFIDDIRGWDFGLNDNDPMPSSDYHETAVAGVIGAVGNNGIGISGVTWQVKLMALKINYTTTDVVNALNYAYNNGADVVNMSFGNYDVTKYGPSSAVKDTIDTGVAQGVLLVATAGNDNIKTERYPGAFEGVIGVAATEESDQRVGFSNWGSWVDVAAPGARILSTVFNNDYNSVNGTSFAAPYVAGLGALIIAQHPEFNLFTLRSVIEYTVDKIQTDRFIGSGRVNCFKAIKAQGIPSLFAIIKSPLNNAAVDYNQPLSITGTSLGDSFIVDYKLDTESLWHLIGSGTSMINGVLATLDPSALPEGRYMIRLTATHGSSQDTDVIYVYIGRSYEVGWPKKITSSILSGITVADLDNDGKKELIFGSYGGVMYVCRNTGEAFPGWPKGGDTGGFLFGAPAVEDIDGDGKLDIVVGSAFPKVNTSQLPRVFAWDTNGVLKKSWQTIDRIYGAVAVADLNKDNIDEIIAASADGKVHAFSYSGAELAGWPVTNSVGTNIQSAPSVGDIDGDGNLEIAISSWPDNKLYVWNSTGQLMPGWPKTGGTHFDSVMVDLDNDGYLEIVSAGTNDYVYVYRFDGSLFPGWPQKVGQAGSSSSLGYSAASIADLDNDIKPEILVGGGDSKKVYIWRSDGQLFPGWPQSVEGIVTTAPAVGDLDGDLKPDVVVATQDGLIYAWNAEGQPLDGFPRSLGSANYRTPTIDDIDGDGNVELIAGTEDGYIFIWDFKTPYRSYTVHWPSFRHDLKNTAQYTSPFTPVVTDQGESTNSTTQLSASWTCSGFESDITEYQYQILQDAPSGTVISSWNSTGTATSVTATDLALTIGKTYYFGVKAKNRAGPWSPVGYSDGITVIWEKNISANSKDQLDPAISGNYIVWEDNRNGNLDIYLYDLTTNTERQISANLANNDYNPAISGNYIVWHNFGDTTGNVHIYLYDLTNNTKRQITPNSVSAGNPAISGNNIVWNRQSNGNYDIYLYDLTTNTERQITTDTKNQYYPAISGNYIVWEDYRNGNSDIYLYDLTTNTERQIITNTSVQLDPAISGNYTVWEDSRNGNPDIYLYDLTTNTERQITTNTASQYNPAISGNYIVWEDWRNGNSDIYLYDLTTNTERQITTNTQAQLDPAISGNYIVWEDKRNGNYDIYLYNLGDTTPPTPPVVTDSGAYTKSKSSFSCSWSSTDPESGSLEYWYRIIQGSPTSGIAITGWTPTTATSVTVSGLNLAQGQTYYFSVKAKNEAGVESQEGYSDGITVDTTKPTTPTITGQSGFVYSGKTALACYWLPAQDEESGIKYYQYRILEGSTTGAVVKNWASVGTNTSATVSGLTLDQAKTYYFAVRAINGARLYGSVVYSTGITIQPDNTPTIGALSPPAPGSGPAGAEVTFTAEYSDVDGWQNISSAYLLVNTSTGLKNCLYAYYNQNNKKLYLRNDANSGWYSPGSSNIIENSYVKIDCSRTTISGSGTTLTINWNITFKDTFKGTKNRYLKVKDDCNAATGWVKKGTWTIE